MNKQFFISDDEDKTRSFAAQLAKGLKASDVVELVGDVGSGKTFFVKALAESVGAGGVSSPSFVIQNQYQGTDFKILHFDFYRLEDPGILKQELEEDLAKAESLIVIEWADSIKGVLPKNRYRIKFEVTGLNSRKLIIDDSSDD